MIVVDATFLMRLALSVEHPGRDFHHELVDAMQKARPLPRPGFSYAT
jgi:hypothetical protein